ncbi:hypothetical protein Tco_1106860 [Tanacetum coccineum]
METNKALLKDEEAEDVDVHLYRSMIGSLMYLTAFRPEKMFDVCACIRFQVTPKVSHLHAVKKIFRYLKGQPKLGLWYPKDSPFDLEAYTDSDYAGISLDKKSTIGGFQFLGRRLISWQCKKQTIVANSTTEAEYVAAANCYGQVLWIQNQLIDYGYNFMNTKIFIDNESTIRIVKNPVFHSKTKHIEIRHHFIRDSYKKRLIQVIKIHTDHNVADLLTKAFDDAFDVADLDADAEVTLIDETQERIDEKMFFDVQDDLQGEEVVAEKEVAKKEVSATDPVTTAGEVVTAASATTIVDELTLAQTLIEIKAAKPKVVTTAATTITTVVANTRLKAKGIVFHDQEEQAHAFTPIVSSSQASPLPQPKDKGKAKMVEPEKPLKKIDQIALDEELVLRLHVEEQAELERMQKERVAQEEASRAAIIEELDSI